MTIRLSLSCPHCHELVTLDVGARIVALDGGDLRTVVAATPVPVPKKSKSVCACGSRARVAPGRRSRRSLHVRRLVQELKRRRLVAEGPGGTLRVHALLCDGEVGREGVAS